MLTALTGYVSDGTEQLTCAQMVPLFGYYFDGGFYPVGGSERLAQVLVEAIEARGGTVRLKTRVERILIDNGRAVGVALADGRRIAARAIVSNADVKRTFLELVGDDALPARFADRLAAAAPGPSAFMIHLGVDYVPDCRPALHLVDQHVGVEVLTQVDPSAAPAGHSTVGIIRLLTNDEARAWFPAAGGDDWKALRFTPEYEAKKRALADAMIAAAETALPGLSAHIVHRSEASPITYARYDLASDGAIYGVSAFRPAARRQEPDPQPRRRRRRDAWAGRRGGRDLRRARRRGAGPGPAGAAAHRSGGRRASGCRGAAGRYFFGGLMMSRRSNVSSPAPPEMSSTFHSPSSRTKL